MYDPHRLRSNDRRFFTHKGQILQAKAITPSFKIEKHKVDAYKKFILKNHLIPSELPIFIDSFKLFWGNGESVETLNVTDLVHTGDQEQRVNLSPATRLCFSVTEYSNYYNFNIFYTTDTTLVFPANTWAAYTIADANRCKVYFKSKGRDLFNTELVLNDNYIKVSDLEIIKTIYHINLPAPESEEEDL